MDSLNGFNVTEVFSQIVDGSDTKLITGSKTTRNLHVDSDASFDRFNDRPLDFSNILRVSADQNITGTFTTVKIYNNFLGISTPRNFFHKTCGEKVQNFWGYFHNANVVGLTISILGLGVGVKTPNS